MEVLKWKYNTGSAINLFFIRDSKHNEIDLLIEKGNNFIPIEIKSADHFDSSFLKGFKLLDPKKFNMPWGNFIVLGTEQNQQRHSCKVLSWRNISEIFDMITT